MSYEKQIIENQKAIQKMLSDAKAINELDELLSQLDNSDLLSLYSNGEDKTVKVTVGVLLQLFSASVGYTVSEKYSIIIRQNQLVYNLPSVPHNIDLYKRGQWQVQKAGYDYDYDNLTGNITIYNANTVDTDYEYRAYGRYSTKQVITVATNGQVLFNYSGAPANVDVYYEGQYIPDSYFTRTKFSDGNSLTITNSELINLIKAGKTLEIRKF